MNRDEQRIRELENEIPVCICEVQSEVSRLASERSRPRQRLDEEIDGRPGRRLADTIGVGGRRGAETGPALGKRQGQNWRGNSSAQQ